MTNAYAAFLACDMPLVRSEVISFLYTFAQNHSAAVPVWKNGELEPLCAVYRVSDVMKAGIEALLHGEFSCKELVSRLPDVSYIEVSRLKIVDPSWFL